MPRPTPDSINELAEALYSGWQHYEWVRFQTISPAWASLDDPGRAVFVAAARTLIDAHHL